MVDVPLTWQLAKLGLSVSMVLGLGTVAVRASPRIAGLLSGYPLGTALALFFIGLEISPAFATQSAVHTLAGFTATMALGAGYLITGRQPGIKGVLGGVLGGFAAWLAVSTLLSLHASGELQQALRASLAQMGLPDNAPLPPPDLTHEELLEFLDHQPDEVRDEGPREEGRDLRRVVLDARVRHAELF